MYAWGPSLIRSMDGFSYYVLCVDHFTKYSWLFPLSHKSDIHGIQHLIIPPYTPQHIASVECRHIVETGLSLLHHAHLPLSLWSFTFKIAIYHINRVPTPVLKNGSPFECLFNSKPNFFKLKIFGCLCYPWLRPYTSHKLEQRSKACLFLGYPN